MPPYGVTSDDLANNISNAPHTYLVGGRQHVLVAVGDTLYAFMLP